MDSIALFLALQALFFVFFSLWFKAKLRRYADEDGMLAQARRDVASLIVELDGTTDRNVTIIEDKLTELKGLIGDAEKRIALLARDKPQRGRAPEAYDRHGLALPFEGSEPSAPVPARAARGGEAAASAAAADASSAAATAVSATALAATAVSATAVAATRQEPPAYEARPVAAQDPAGANGAYAYAGALPDQAPFPAEGPGRAELPQVRLRSRPASQASAPILRQASEPLAIEEPFPDRVMALYRRGMSTELIASQLGAHLSEVEIVVAMEEGRSRRSGNA